MALLPKDAYGIELPRMHRVEQQFDPTALADYQGAIGAAIMNPRIRVRIKPGMRIALLVGSRGVFNLEGIVRAVGQALKSLGAEPFIVPAMGSHGGAAADGQTEILASYGITQARVGMEIVSSMEVSLLGKTANGVPVYADRNALSADMIVPIARVKPHTDFHGPIESGLCKMLSVGIGKHVGCTALHRYGFDRFAWLIPEVGAYVIRHAPVGFGLAIIENAYEKTYVIEAVPSERILSREPEMLSLARRLMPRILLKQIDVLVIEQIGKDISGAGMDPNIVGRTTRGRLTDYDVPMIGRILVEGVSDASHGNACGIGLADFMLARCGEQIDRQATAINAISSGNPEAARLPVAVSDEAEGVLACALTTPDCSLEALRIVKIRDTLSLGEIWVSDALIEETERHPQLHRIDELDG